MDNKELLEKSIVENVEKKKELKGKIKELDKELKKLDKELKELLEMKEGK